MTQRPRSLRYEYELFVDREIEDYKESIPRLALLSIGDEAVRSLAAQQQLALTEILMCHEVDRIIISRLRVPAFSTWRRRRLKSLKEFCRPERWGLRPDCALARTLTTAGEGHVLVAEANEEGPALYLAANGCAVTALDTTERVLERVLNTAAEVGLMGRVRGFVADLASWAPDMPLNAVVCASGALSSLSVVERARTISILQEATTVGGVHLVETLADGKRLLHLDELKARYRGWQISIEQELQARETFMACKAVA